MDLLTHIHTLISIAEQGSLAGAARARGVAPSAITASLNRLESHVGGKLIMRSTRSLSLTQEGVIFLEQCRRIVSELDEAVEQVTKSGPLKGTIRLTSINDFGRMRLPELMDSFLKIHPEVRFDLTLGDDVIDLIDGGYDLAVRTGPLSDSRLTARQILEGGRSVCAAPVYWKTHGKPTKPEELSFHNCLVLSRRNNPQNIWHFHHDNRHIPVHVKGDRTASDGGLLRSWAVSGVGVALKADYDIVKDVAEGRLETVLDEFKQRNINLYLVHAAGRNLSRRVQTFMDHISNSLNK
ncbi:LysR family transcriptional regulator [Raoultella ornithinolytica]|uniref:LysR family transcriptional regulator n=1 Tax=Raoultella ornithinolytica TaxID=54291 RepID=UPI001159AEDB|nr:LysR family transcriptional regulator [Raoultella ornithinolytica]